MDEMAFEIFVFDVERSSVKINGSLKIGKWICGKRKVRKKNDALRYD